MTNQLFKSTCRIFAILFVVLTSNAFFSPEAKAEQQDTHINLLNNAKIVPFKNDVAFRATSNGKYLAANTKGTFVVAAAYRLPVGTCYNNGCWEVFSVKSLGQYWFSMVALNGKYVRAGVGQEGKVAAVSNHRALWESFRIKSLGNNRCVFIDGKNRHLTVKNGYLQASDDPFDYEIFEYIQF